MFIALRKPLMFAVTVLLLSVAVDAAVFGWWGKSAAKVEPKPAPFTPVHKQSGFDMAAAQDWMTNWQALQKQTNSLVNKNKALMQNAAANRLQSQKLRKAVAQERTNNRKIDRARAKRGRQATRAVKRATRRTNRVAKRATRVKKRAMRPIERQRRRQAKTLAQIKEKQRAVKALHAGKKRLSKADQMALKALNELPSPPKTPARRANGNARKALKSLEKSGADIRKQIRALKQKRRDARNNRVRSNFDRQTKRLTTMHNNVNKCIKRAKKVAGSSDPRDGDRLLDEAMAYETQFQNQLAAQAVDLEAMFQQTLDNPCNREIKVPGVDFSGLEGELAQLAEQDRKEQAAAAARVAAAARARIPQPSRSKAPVQRFNPPQPAYKPKPTPVKPVSPWVPYPSFHNMAMGNPLSPRPICGSA